MKQTLFVVERFIQTIGYKLLLDETTLNLSSYTVPPSQVPETAKENTRHRLVAITM